MLPGRRGRKSPPPGIVFLFIIIIKLEELVYIYACIKAFAVNSKVKTYLKRLGWAGFLFFLIKGLIWIGVFLFVKSQI